MTAEVVIPFAGDCPYRERARRWVMDRCQGVGVPARLGLHAGGEWCKAQALNSAVESSDAEIIAVSDADVWTAGLAEAVGAVAGGAPWAIPHRDVHRLTERSTEEVLAGADWRDAETEQAPYKGLPGGGIVVAAREVIEAIPPDPRFVGWGQEDESWAMALETLLGPPWRGGEPLVHLWHPPQERMTRRRGSAANWSLRCRYLAARGDPEAMRTLLEEFRVADPSAEPAVHDHA